MFIATALYRQLTTEMLGVEQNICLTNNQRLGFFPVFGTKEQANKTVDIGYDPSMFSDSKWELKINGVVVYYHFDRKRVEEMSSFILEKLRQFNLSGVWQ